MVSASVIVRLKDEERTIEATLRSLRNQTVAVELIVVDSGSRDGSLDIARRWADRVVEVPPTAFSYGHALNIGAAAASAPFHFALSAHCVAPTSAWIEMSVAHYARSDVAATSGELFTPDFQRLGAPFFQTADTVLKDRCWGYSNHAGSWRAEAWHAEQFDERMDASEDKEWAQRVLSHGWVIVHDPELNVPTGHRRSAGLRPLYGRVKRESRAAWAYSPPEQPFTAVRAVASWWSEFPFQSSYPRFVRLLSPYRFAEISGRWAGEREGRRNHPLAHSGARESPLSARGNSDV